MKLLYTSFMLTPQFVDIASVKIHTFSHVIFDNCLNPVLTLDKPFRKWGLINKNFINVLKCYLHLVYQYYCLNVTITWIVRGKVSWNPFFPKKEKSFKETRVADLLMRSAQKRPIYTIAYPNDRCRYKFSLHVIVFLNINPQAER